MAIEGFDFSSVHPLHERLCLDYVNSTPNHSDPSENYLNGYADLVSWSVDVGLLRDGEVLASLEVASPDRRDWEARLQGVGHGQRNLESPSLKGGGWS